MAWTRCVRRDRTRSSNSAQVNVGGADVARAVSKSRRTNERTSERSSDGTEGARRSRAGAAGVLGRIGARSRPADNACSSQERRHDVGADQRSSERGRRTMSNLRPVKRTPRARLRRGRHCGEISATRWLQTSCTATPFVEMWRTPEFRGPTRRIAPNRDAEWDFRAARRRAGLHDGDDSTSATLSMGRIQRFALVAKRPRSGVEDSEQIEGRRESRPRRLGSGASFRGARSLVMGYELSDSSMAPLR